MKSSPSKHRSPARTLTPAKKRAFFVITLLTPVIAVFLLEVLLRVFRYGPDLSLFKTEAVAGKPYLVMNPDVKARYFSSVQFSPTTSMDYFQVPKPPGTYRIFCLGASTTVGFPYGYCGAYSSFLRDRLYLTFPRRSVEIVNLGMTATNSYTVNDLASEIMAYQPDLLIVETGHNEFYGAFGIASHESLGSHRWLIKLYLKMIHVRTFLLLRDAFQAIVGVFSSQHAGSPGTMMERLAVGHEIQRGSPEYKQGLDNFRANLRELTELCVSQNVPVILSTQVSNLRDLPPFVSEVRSDSSTPGWRVVHGLFGSGMSQLSKGKPDSALSLFAAAMMMDSTRADLHYWAAKCLDTLGRKLEALKEYRAARDLDMLRFRASSDFNAVIRSMADNRKVFLADMVRKFKANSPDSLVGDNLILEHLHPNLRGYFLMAKEYAEVMQTHSLLAPAPDWYKDHDVPDNQLWAAKPVTEVDERAAERRIRILTSGWPFTSHDTLIPGISPQDTLGDIVERLVDGKTTWEQTHVAAASFFEHSGRVEKAEREYLTLIDQLPINVSPYLLLGRLLLREDKQKEAYQVLLQSLNVEKTSYAYQAIGTVLYNGGDPAASVECFKQAYSLAADPQARTTTGYLLGLAYARTGRKEDAINLLQQVIAESSGYQPAVDLMRHLKGQGD